MCWVEKSSSEKLKGMEGREEEDIKRYEEGGGGRGEGEGKAEPERSADTET